MSDTSLIKIQLYPVDRQRIDEIKMATETRSSAQVIRDAIRCYLQVIGQKLPQTVP